MSRLSVVGSLPVPVSPEEAWAAWSRVEDWPRWDWMGSASARWLEGEPWAPGSRLRVGHRPFAFDCLLVESRPPEAVTWASRGAGLHTMHTWRFLPHPEGCLVRDVRGVRRPRRPADTAPGALVLGVPAARVPAAPDGQLARAPKHPPLAQVEGDLEDQRGPE